MLRLLFVLLAWLVATPSWGQKASASQVCRDSLRRVFNQEPPFIEVAYAHNWQLVPSTRVHFYVKHGRRPVAVHHVPGQGYLLPPRSRDSLALGVSVGGRLQWFSPMPAHFYAHGASIVFGYLDRAHLHKQADTGEGERVVLRAMEDEPWLRDKRLQGVHYQIIYPRVFGDGMVFVQPLPIFRK